MTYIYDFKSKYLPNIYYLAKYIHLIIKCAITNLKFHYTKSIGEKSNLEKVQKLLKTLSLQHLHSICLCIYVL